MKQKNIIYIAIFILVSTFVSCTKFLDVKPDKQLMIPVTLDEFITLLDGNLEMNLSSITYGLLASDDYYLSNVDFNNEDPYVQNMYIWADNSIPDKAPNDWSNTYGQVYNTNIVLDGMEKIERTAINKVQWDNLRGMALFFRGRAILEAASLWTNAYDASTATTDLGMPLRTSADFADKATRATLQETYDQILADLTESAALLPAIGINKIRPSKAGAYGYLSRAYLAMRDYEKAGKYADSCLMINSQLLDYADLDPYDYEIFPGYSNQEIVSFFTTDLSYSYTPRIDEDFYDSYSGSDYRKDLFFFESRTDGSILFQGSYEPDRGYTYFTGIATDEMYLTRAECFARAGNTGSAMKDLNSLLSKRIWKFVDLTAPSADAALKIILEERRKELVLRGTRWMDLKRLNKEPEHQVTLTRTIDGKEYTLTPNDPKYVMPIPDKVIRLSGMPQNPRK